MTSNAKHSAGRRPARWLALAVVGALAWLAAAGPVRAAEGVSAGVAPFSADGSMQVSGSWRFTGLPNKPPTHFDIVNDGAQQVLRVEADKSYGNLVHATRVPLNSGTTLSWHWKVDEFVQNTDLRTRSGDDGAAKLCVFFNFPASQLSLGERTRLAVARAATGEDVPSEALCYVWDGKEPKGTALDNVFTRRMRMVVLESGPTGAAGGWLVERRNLLADYRRAFGDESGGAMPDVVAVAISADADSTQGHGVSYFSEVDLK